MSIHKPTYSRVIYTKIFVNQQKRSSRGLMLKFAHRLRTNSNKRKPISGYSKLLLVQTQYTSFPYIIVYKYRNWTTRSSHIVYMKYKRIFESIFHLYLCGFFLRSYFLSYIKSSSYKHSIMKCLLTYSCSSILGSFLLNQNYTQYDIAILLYNCYTSSHKAISIQNIFTST